MRQINTLVNTEGKLFSFKEFQELYFNYDSDNRGENFIFKARDRIKEKLKKLENLTRTNSKKIKFFNIILDDFEKIVTALPLELDGVIDKIETEKERYLGKNDKNKYKKLNKELSDIFNYEGFRGSNHLKWFIKSLNVKSCLYCNAQFTTSVNLTGKTLPKLLFQIDHFYNQSDYPYLSLTMGNLVPSCSYCNNTKGKPKKSEFKLKDNIHPYLDDLNSFFYYKVEEDDILEFMTNNKKFSKIVITPTCKDGISLTNYIKFENHLKKFKLTEQCEAHSDIVEELIMKSLHYNDIHKNELINTFKGLNIDEGLIDRFILGNYTLDEEINLRPLSKLSKDIAKQLKLIK